MTQQLAGKSIVITGAFGALGAATARAAAKTGGCVALIDRAPQAPPGLIAACGTDAIECGGVDLTNSLHAVRAVDLAYERLGSLHVVINIAGMFRWQTVADGDPETWDRLFAVNVKTAVNTSRAALRHMTKSTVASSTLGRALLPRQQRGWERMQRRRQAFIG